MDHAQTIAMATDLLADGRAEDVAQMVDPLLAPVEAPASSTGQLLLRGLRARIEIVHRDRPDHADEMLPSLEAIEDLCTCVQAEVALWRGWIRTRRSSTPAAATGALRLLGRAEELFESVHDPRGRCWTRLGQAQAFYNRREYALMRRALRDAESLVDRLDDRQAARWLHDLSVPALRAAGRFDAAEQHLHALRALARDQNDRRLRGHAAAHEAALRYDRGRPPAEIVSTAETAEALLRRVDAGAPTPLGVAYRAHIGALLRQGDWAEADAVLDEAEAAAPDAPAEQAPFQILRARIALRRDDGAAAERHVAALLEDASALPHGVHWAPLALLRGEVRAHHNDLEAASTWLERAHRTARESGHRGLQLRSLLTLARTAAARGERAAARSHLAAADAYDDYLGVLPAAVRRFSTTGTIAQIDDRPQAAIEAYRHALAAATMMGDRYRTASLRLALAQLEGDDRAHALAGAARSTFDALGCADEATVATALADGTSPSTADASARPYPTDALSDAALGDTLAAASCSTSLVAYTWLQAAAARLPDRWVGVYRLSADGIASPLHEHGRRPEGIEPPSRPDAADSPGPVRWQPLHSTRPTLCLGVEAAPTDDADARPARSFLRRWTPLVRLAHERAQLRHRQARPDASDRPLRPVPVDGFVAESEAMTTVRRRMAQLHPSHGPVLITGESGAGKRHLGEALHALSERADGPLRHVGCATMQREPLGERLFGRVDSAGALTPGAAHEADGGTLLIEDVDALPPDAQDALLHLLDTGEVVPANATDGTAVDVRVLATTDAQLDAEVEAGRFRPALRDRLGILSLRMPPLRERRADIPLLVRHFLDALRAESIKDTAEAPVTQPAMEALLRYDWPGNVRQLRNELERALVHVENEPAQTIDRTVLLDQIVEDAQSSGPPPSVDAPDAILHPDQTLNDVLSQTEAALIRRVLRACDGQITASAEVLGLSRQGLYKKMKRLGIDASDPQPASAPAPTPSS
jgi:DNA-binding NtrC family response regulator/tetratricopeptide (TPR) repeat protein